MGLEMLGKVRIEVVHSHQCSDAGYERDKSGFDALSTAINIENPAEVDSLSIPRPSAGRSLALGFVRSILFLPNEISVSIVSSRG